MDDAKNEKNIKKDSIVNGNNVNGDESASENLSLIIDKALGSNINKSFAEKVLSGELAKDELEKLSPGMCGLYKIPKSKTTEELEKMKKLEKAYFEHINPSDWIVSGELRAAWKQNKIIEEQVDKILDSIGKRKPFRERLIEFFISFLGTVIGGYVLYLIIQLIGV